MWNLQQATTAQEGFDLMIADMQKEAFTKVTGATAGGNFKGCFFHDFFSGTKKLCIALSLFTTA